MIINNVELAFDLLNLETAKQYQAALNQLEQNKDGEETNLTAMIQRECKAIFTFFDSVFGKGTAKKLFGGQCHLGNCLQAMDTVMQEATRQKAEMRRHVTGLGE